MGNAVKAFHALGQDEFGSPLRVVLNFIVPEPDDCPALAFKERGSTCVMFDRFCMLATVKLDCQFRFPAGQIDDERPDDQLTGEPGTVSAQSDPQQTFRFG